MRRLVFTAHPLTMYLMKTIFLLAIAEANQHKFKLTGGELDSRRHFIRDTRQIVKVSLQFGRSTTRAVCVMLVEDITTYTLLRFTAPRLSLLWSHYVLICGSFINSFVWHTCEHVRLCLSIHALLDCECTTILLWLSCPAENEGSHSVRFSTRSVSVTKEKGTVYM